MFGSLKNVYVIPDSLFRIGVFKLVSLASCGKGLHNICCNFCRESEEVGEFLVSETAVVLLFTA